MLFRKLRLSELQCQFLHWPDRRQIFADRIDGQSHFIHVFNHLARQAGCFGHSIKSVKRSDQKLAESKRFRVLDFQSCAKLHRVNYNINLVIELRQFVDSTQQPNLIEGILGQVSLSSRSHQLAICINIEPFANVTSNQQFALFGMFDRNAGQAQFRKSRMACQLEKFFEPM